MCIPSIIIPIIICSFINVRYSGASLTANATLLEPNMTHTFTILAATSQGQGESRNFTAVTKQLGNY